MIRRAVRIPPAPRNPAHIYAIHGRQWRVSGNFTQPCGRGYAKPFSGRSKISLGNSPLRAFLNRYLPLPFLNLKWYGSR